jgi:hypothetical protein
MRQDLAADNVVYAEYGSHPNCTWTAVCHSTT